MTWERILELFLEIINKLIEQFQRKEKVKDDKAGQDNENQINSDPAGWFNNHFDSRVRGQETVSKPNSATTETPSSDSTKK